MPLINYLGILSRYFLRTPKTDPFIVRFFLRDFGRRGPRENCIWWLGSENDVPRCGFQVRVSKSHGHLGLEKRHVCASLDVVWASCRSGNKSQARKGNTNPNLWVLISSCWVGVLPCEGVGVKKLGMPLETQEFQIFGGEMSRDFRRDIPGAGGARKVREKFVFNSSLKKGGFVI